MHLTEDKNVVLLLLMYGAHINPSDKNGETPLHAAAKRRYRSFEVIETLLNEGANIHTRNRWDKTALSYADDDAVVRLMARHGAYLE